MSTNPEPPNHGPLGLPLLSGKGRTDEQHWKWVLRRLGGGIVDIELTSEGDMDPLTGEPFLPDETHQADCLDETKRWFAQRVGAKKWIQVEVRNGQGAYLMPPETIDVVDFVLPSFQLPTLDADQFSYTYFSLLFGQWTNPNVAPMPYSDLEQRLMYLKDIGKIFSTDRDWAYDEGTRTLEILPAPGSIGAGAGAGQALARIWSWNVDPRHLDPQDDGFYRRYLLIQAMKTLGNIRSTVDSWINMGGEKAMNGETLMSNAEGMEEALKADVLNWKRATGVLLL